MQIELRRERAALDLVFGSSEALDNFVQDATRRGSFLVRLDEDLPLDSRWRVRLKAPGREHEVEARAIEKLDAVSGEIAVRFELADPVARSESAPTAELPPPPQAPRETPPAAAEGEVLGSSPIHRIRELNPGQRSLLAMKASRAERQILQRDSSPQVLQSLLANPRLEAKEVLALVGSTAVTASILQRVAGDARWGKNREIVTAVAKNPKTPTPLATRLMERLRTQDLRRMARMSGGLKEVVRRAALREYLRRTEGR